MVTLQTASMIAAAVRAARARTKDASIGVAVRAGKYQLQRITYRASGCANVEPRSSFMPADEMVALLNSL